MTDTPLTSSLDETFPQRLLPEPSPQRDALLKLLESEIALLVQRQKNSGWTSWALMAAIGAIVWTLLQQWESGWPANGKWILVYLSLALCFHLLREVTALLQGRYSPKSVTRFHFGAQRGSRLSKTWALVQSVIAFACLFYSELLSPSTIYIACSLAALACVFRLYQFVSSFRKSPVAASSSIEDTLDNFSGVTRRVLIGLIVFCVILYLAALAIPLFFMSRDLLTAKPSVIDVKIGGLFAVLGFLFRSLLEEISSQPLIETLLTIRRELALGGMSLEEAARQIEIEFLGLQVADIFRESAQKFVVHANAVDSECKRIAAQIDESGLLSGEKMRFTSEQGVLAAQALLSDCSGRNEGVTSGVR